MYGHSNNWQNCSKNVLSQAETVFEYIVLNLSDEDLEANREFLANCNEQFITKCLNKGPKRRFRTKPSLEMFQHHITDFDKKWWEPISFNYFEYVLFDCLIKNMQ